MQFASGIPVNLRSNLELNNDGTASDRPLDVARNSLTLPSRKNVDFRYSRKFRIQGSMAAEVIAELKNIVQHRAGVERERHGDDQRAGRAGGAAADVGRPAHADRRVRAAPVPARLQVRFLIERQDRSGRRANRQLSSVHQIMIFSSSRGEGPVSVRILSLVWAHAAATTRDTASASPRAIRDCT